MVITFSAFRLLLGIYIFVWLINMKAFGIDANPIQKAIALALAASFLLTRHVDRMVLTIVVAILTTTFACALLSSYNALSFGRYFSSLVSLSAILLLLPGRMNLKDRRFLLKLLAWCPVLCVLIGAIYDVMGVWSLWRQDYLGVVRLQGSTISAGLGTIGYVGVIASVFCSVYYNKKFLLLAAVDIVILALSAARMPFAMAAMCAIVIFYYFHGRSFARVYLSTIALIGVAFAGFLAIGDKIAARFESENSSGRDLIWDVLLNELKQYPDFGIGLGHQIVVVPEDVIEKTLTIAAHNEYLRLAVETGYVGVTVIMSLFAVLFLYVFLSRPKCRNPAFLTVVASFFIYCYTDNVISSNTAIFALVMACAMSISPKYKSRRNVTAPTHQVESTSSEPMLA